ncbi:4-(cytidine 5'-diphospho)-2-C-methyl-D-erythritol kinase [Kingella sp. SNUBH-2017]|uniref:4-(cytidine 5'-diphospho)-2-C-methyl-D-erythritol kinase n=1 Tax=Kingella sp. SNUBH-2017 TaxID=2994077 RepID=UPI00236364BF|nr:4-(cytidine 5'-diphospho)-2-C-methyl-D-erythritol kinase [Kingella sp. SNUBH-2017]MDD2182581.1 4-(cytidine 5'-diphospho)-2-C-methyl-D-erythritol kinase [Kingella sp. SNUBH-2017]
MPSYPAPAKLNLDLRITGRRADGYHELESIFTLIDLQDTLDIEPRDDGRIVLHTPLSDVPPEQDLCVRAARALQNFSGCLKGADIRVEKRIPTGGGLGGGSSDAATVLMVLNRLWDLNLPSNTLQKIGLTLGADVPFFLFGQSAFARGIGEILTPLALPPQWYVLVRPNVHVATPKVFAHPDLPRDSTPCAAPSFAALQPFRNDMQAVVLAEYPPVTAAFRLLQDYGNPRMTGSGACLFLAFDNAAEAEAVLSRLPETLESWCVAGLAEHPLRFQAA